MEEKSYNSPWSLKLNTVAPVPIPAAVGINYIGRLFTGILKLLPWLDSIGTCLVACLADLAAGTVAGATDDLIYSPIMDLISTVYIFSQAVLGIVVRLMPYYGWVKDLRGTILTGVPADLAVVIVSAPLNVMFWGGITDNLWGDIVYAGTLPQGLPAWIVSTVDGIVVNLPDKIVVLLLVVGLHRGLPKGILSLYQSNSKTESLD